METSHAVALGAKNKYGFVDGSFKRPIDSAELLLPGINLISWSCPGYTTASAATYMIVFCMPTLPANSG